MDNLPEWNSHGIIPPFVVAPTDENRSPYVISLMDFALRFATTIERIKIFKGFMQYRKDLHSIGIVSGFQWLDGSFLENTEQTKNRSPKDIDVTTFFNLPVKKHVIQRRLKRKKRQQYFAPPIISFTQKSIIEKNPELFDSI
ncbi:MAG: hypothetical protein LBU65_08835, partial [Planctomycetaceae bacterium]|nr:hypothetical protein [Planctomycetaceae bacterium]